MSELQLDDPDPLPNSREYPVNYQTELAFEDDGLAAEYAEMEAIESLSRTARLIIEHYGEGEIGAMHAYMNDTELHHIISPNHTHIFGFIDRTEEGERCRSWVDGGIGVSWCEDEQRYEPAGEVEARLLQQFPLPEVVEVAQVSSPLEGLRRGSLRLKRALAATILR